MLMGNEPVSTGNIRASLGNFTHHRAGAVYEQFGIDGIVKTGYMDSHTSIFAVPIDVGSKMSAFASFDGGVFKSDKPGVFEFSLEAKFKFVKTDGSIKKSAIVLGCGGSDILVAERALSSYYNEVDVAFSKIIAVPEDGVSIRARTDFGSEWGSVYVEATNMKISIIEI